MRNLGSDADIAWVCWSTKALVAASEAVEFAGDILHHQSLRLRSYAERRFRRFLQVRQPAASSSSPEFRDDQHGAPSHRRWSELTDEERERARAVTDEMQRESSENHGGGDR